MPPLTECGHGCGTSILCALCWFLQPRQIGKWLFAQLVPHCFCTAVVTAAVTAHWIEMLMLPPCAHGMNGSDDKHLFVKSAAYRRYHSYHVHMAAATTIQTSV